MRITREQIVRGKGFFTVIADSVDDLWVLYNTICVGDRVYSSTLRKVAVGFSGTVNERVRVSLEVCVEELLFDPEQGEIRVSGVVTSQVEHVKLGSHHTLEVSLHNPVSVHKEEWDALALESIRACASGVGRGVELVAVMMDAGNAQVCLVSKGLTVVKSKVSTTLPKKRSGEGAHGDAMGKFFDATLAALLRSLDWEGGEEGGSGGGGGGAASPSTSPPPILIASPGTIKEAFHAHLQAAIAHKPVELKGIGRARVVCASAAAGSKWALSEALADPAVAAALSDLQVLGEVNLMGAWQAQLGKDAERAQYGWRHCCAAADRGAIDTLLVSDRLTRTGGSRVRAEVARLMEQVRASKGKVAVLSSMHASGEVLCGMGGVVCTLRYPVHDLEEAALEYSAAPGGAGVGGGSGGGGGGGGGGGVKSPLSPPSLPGHKLQERPSEGSARSGAAVDKFGVSGWDTDSDRSDDSDA